MRPRPGRYLHVSSAFRAFSLPGAMRKNSTRDRDTDRVANSSESQEIVVFLGRFMTPAEYDVCCRNLREFFDLLESWQLEESDEPS